ncbi:glycerophosphodiester phosphodiesterase [Aquibacillus rhizosphaerae]|uniref:Glycerophosphodiester phosphodiesterase family protein n=1 Tax=Aquibacillus rhizosphaerae TaxID=3051431 RepID=A0ABT7L7R3_9BACI|nr:glycerophosphodiester phosphodiesterase family protein [Aquibacillus sp. LR5S19]MDL4841887.1 glycerophosphodiester phosphodiesterase family protein [Aquibacillus sp. LR5S19]
MRGKRCFDKKMVFFFLVLSYLCTIIILVGAQVENQPVPSMVDQPKIIAHRGANDRFNESTLTAYEIAAKDGVDSLEIDLRLTKDNSLVAIHDQSVDRTTDGAGKVIDFTLEEIQKFSTVAVFGNNTHKEEIPTLEDILEKFVDTEHYYIETRLVDGRLVMEEQLVQLLNEYGLIEKGLVTIQSFSEESLNKITELAPEVPLTLLFKKGQFDLSRAKQVEFPYIGIETTDVTRKVVNELHKQGKEVHVYFNNRDTEKSEQKRVKALLVDGYFTNDITYTKELFKQ